MTDKDERWAIFWCSLLQPILFADLPQEERNAILQKISETPAAFPDGTFRNPSLSTLKRKLEIYQTGGLLGFARKPRSDRGEPRAFKKEVVEKAIELKRTRPKRGPRVINKFLLAKFGETIPESTLFRYLTQAGATRLKLGVSKEPVRCRWTMEHTHDLWVGDYADGPMALDGDTPVATHLVGFIDCHSRYTVEANYYRTEAFDTLIDALMKAWGIHGSPRALYFDNAKIFVSDPLKSACLQTHTDLLHRPVGDPSPGGLIERFFLTLQNEFEYEIRSGPLLPLPQLNRALSAWLDVCYHSHVHSETQQTPDERYHKGLVAIRKVDLDAVRPFFMEKEPRKVHPDFSDVQIHNFFFKVDPKLRGDKVIVRFDPYGDKQSVLIYSLDDRYLGRGTRHNREKSSQPKPQPSSPTNQKESFIDLIIDLHDQQLQAKADAPASPPPKKPYPLHVFAQTLARLLGLHAGTTAFSTREFELIHRAYLQCPNLNDAFVNRAFELTRDPSLLTVIHTLNTMTNRQQQREES